MESRALDRVTAFTDAAVAIALTLLVLPLVDVGHDSSGTPVRALLQEHGSDMLAFGLSFFVIMAFWRGHRRLFEPVVRLDETLLSLNVLWLLGIVFLPVPTAVLAFEGQGQRGATLLYLSNLLFLALMAVGMTGWISSHPELLETRRRETMHHHLRRGLILLGTLAVVTALAVPLGAAALILLAVLPAGQAVGRRIDRRRGLEPPV